MKTSIKKGKVYIKASKDEKKTALRLANNITARDKQFITHNRTVVEGEEVKIVLNYEPFLFTVADMKRLVQTKKNKVLKKC